MFALQSTAAEPVIVTTLLQTSAMTPVVSNVVDDALSADFGEVSASVDMLEISEVDVDKITLSALSYPVPETTHAKPDPLFPHYHFLVCFWLDRPPQLT